MTTAAAIGGGRFLLSILVFGLMAVIPQPAAAVPFPRGQV
ncbi:hypothetical protein LINPERPRIM_LOCUS34635, partial [Linum perenne]